MFATVIFLALSVRGQNVFYPDSSKLIFTAPETVNKNGFFGYSMTYVPQLEKEKKSLIISAPIADSVGDLFKCDFHTTSCTEIATSVRNCAFPPKSLATSLFPTICNSSENRQLLFPLCLHPSRQQLKNIKAYNRPNASSLWLGAKLQAGSSFFVTCASRLVPYNRWNERMHLQKCFYYNVTAGLMKPAKRLSRERNHRDIFKHYDPKNDPVRWDEFNHKKWEELKKGYKWRQFPYHLQADSFGWSIEVPNDEIVLIGGPAIMIGRVLVYRHGFKVEPDLISLDNKKISGSNGRIEYQFGYSITSGNFFFDKLTYAVSSPYGEMGRGKVLFFDTNLEYIPATIVDDDVGNIFGASLCAVNNGSMLLVGAPAWAYNGSDATPTEVGAMHLYTPEGNTINNLRWKRVRTISELKSYSNFGAEIVNLGDLNRDGNDDIAVAAPYENEGRGAVYIYSGSEFLKNSEEKRMPYVQKIVGDNSQDFLGLGLSVLKDYDENGCNELAIGIPGANKVKLLRCMALVTIKLGIDNNSTVQEAIGKIQEIEDGKTYVELNRCLYVVYENKEKPVDIITEIIVQAEISDNVEAHEHMQFKAILKGKEPKYCEPIKLYFYNNKDYDKKIEFKLSAEILNTTESFQANTVAFSEQSVDHFSINFILPGSKLSFALKPNIDLDHDYLIGSTDFNRLDVEVKKSGRLLKNWCIKFHIEGITLKFINQGHCDVQGFGVLNCTGDFSDNDTHVTKLDLYPDSITSESKYVTIETTIYKICDEPSTLGQTKTLKIPLRTDNNLTVNGELSPPLSVTTYELRYEEQTVNHYYKIENYGVTHWKGLKFRIDLPPHGKTNIHLTGSCNIGDRLAECILDDLPSNSYTDVLITMSPMRGTINNFPDSKISTHLTLFFAENEIKASVHTRINILDKNLPIWVIIVASIVAFLILLIIGFILRECGCLTRKNKENLTKLKREVRRQSQIRMSMRIRDSVMNTSPQEDTQKLVDINEDEPLPDIPVEQDD